MGAAILMALAVTPAAAYAQSAYDFDLPSQPLSDTLLAIGVKTGVNVVFDPIAVRGKAAAAIKGTFSAQEAVRRALDGTGLSYHSTNAGSLLVEPAVAQIPPSDVPSAVNELIVTATKRSESIQRAPLSITAFSEKALNESGVTGLQDYAAQVPNLAIAYTGYLGATGQRITIRGIYGANTTGVYIDDTPLPESVDPRVLDLNRIEVLRGPQGTLYGARSEGGTVRLITNQPDAGAFSGSIHAVGSTTDSGGGTNGAIDGVVNVPLIKDKVAFRFNAFDDYESGFMTRAASPAAPVDFATQTHLGSSQSRGAAMALQANLFDDKLVITPRFLTETTHDTNHLWADITPDNFTQYRLFNINEPGSDNINLYSVTIRYSTAVGDIISSTSEFVRHAYDTEDDSEFASYALGTPPAPFICRTFSEEKDFSEELRFVSNLKGPLQFTTGVFYQDSKNFSYQPATTYSVPGAVISDVFDEHFHTRVDEIAVFGEVSYLVTSKLKLTAGGRYFDNRVDFNGEEGGITTSPDPTIVTGKQKETGFNPKFGAQYQVDNDHMLYASAAKGFRIGGVNVIPAALCASDLAALHLRLQTQSEP
jgi:outer membrane receptor protein involved in Fe transport